MLEHSFSRLFVPWNIYSHDGTLRTIRSLDRSFPGTLFQVPWTFPAADHSFICQQSSTWSTYKEGTGNKQKRRLMTATVHSRYTQTVDRRYSVSHLNRFSSSERGLLNNSFGAFHCQKNVHYECMRHLQIKR